MLWNRESIKKNPYYMVHPFSLCIQSPVSLFKALMMLHLCKGFGFASAVSSDSLTRSCISPDNRSSETSSALKKEDGSYQHLLWFVAFWGWFLHIKSGTYFGSCCIFIPENTYFCKENFLQAYKGNLCSFVSCLHCLSADNVMKGMKLPLCLNNKWNQ